MPAPNRDLELTAKQLQAWFGSQLPRARALAVSGLAGPGTTGFSNDTLMFDLCWREEGREQQRALVLRLEPRGTRVFPSYDLGLQFRILRALAETDVPVPEVYWQEPDPGVLGAPFYVMERIEGLIPSDNPPYHAEGWMTEISPEERASIWWSGLEALARIHTLDWRRLGVLEPSRAGLTPLEEQLDYYQRYLAWAAQGERYPTSEAAFGWLASHRPREPEPTALCWGDARLGNMIFRGGRCVAVLDWEMVTLGNPVEDVAWWLFFDEHHSAGCGLPRLSGLPSPEETLARYQAWSGIEVQHLDYYDVFAAFRFSVIMIRVAQQLKDAGLLPPDSEFGSNNICTRLLQERLERVSA